MPRPTVPFTLIVLLMTGAFSTLFAPAAEAAAVDAIGVLPLPTGHEGITGNAAAYMNGYTYIFGGRIAHSNYYSDVIYAYNHATGTTEAVGTLPAVSGSTDENNNPFGGRQESAAAVIGGKIYVFGGAVIVQAALDATHPDQRTPVPKSINEIVEFDPVTRDAHTLATEHLPNSMWGMAAVQYGSVIYIFGGFSFDVQNTQIIKRYDTIVRFDPSAPLNKVTTLAATLPYPVQDSGAALAGSRIYVFGGLQDDVPNTYPCPKIRSYNQRTGEYNDYQPTTCRTDKIVSFNPVTENVNGVVGALPYRAQFLSAATVRNKIYVPGGLLSDNGVSASVIEYDPARPVDARIRVLTPTLPAGLFAAGTTTDGKNVVMFGGRGQNLTNLSANITRIDPGPTAPWGPRSAVAHPLGSTVQLSWDPPSYDGDSPVTGYNVYRTAPGEDEAFIQRVTTLSLTDTGLVPGAQYFYRVTAVNDIGESRTSARASTLSEIVPPGPVASFVAFEGNGSVTLRWTPPTDTGGANISVYRLYRNESDTPTDTVPGSTLEYRDTGLANNATYAYAVHAVNSKGEGAASPTLRVTPKAVPDAPAHATAVAQPSGNVTISWDQPPVGVRSVVIQRGTTPANLATIVELPGTSKTFTDTATSQGRTYYYSLRASNDVGASPPTPLLVVSLVSKPGAPVNVAAAGFEGGIRVSWQAPDVTGVIDSSIITYYITRDPGTERESIIASDLKGGYYDDRALLANQTHSYTVTTVNGLESDPSDVVSAAAKPVINKVPVSSLAILTSAVQANETVLVDASLSNDPDGSIVEYSFDWGDGSTPTKASSSNATHVYAANGTYIVSVTAEDNRGAKGAPATAPVIVGSPAGDAKDPDKPDIPPKTTDQPGTGKTKGLPDVTPVGLLLVLALVAARHRRK